ncbi:MAG: hypothetical protein AAGU27_22075 [Dehalobacterium sp.]
MNDLDFFDLMINISLENKDKEMFEIYTKQKKDRIERLKEEYNHKAKLIFDNAGGLTLQLGQWGHWYANNNMKQGAKDYQVFITYRSTDGWGGHEEAELALDPSEEQIRNRGYRIYGEDQIEEQIYNKKLSPWNNINDFCREIRKLRELQGYGG